ncbi:MAG: zinc-dependent alcohol dehydrogenase family protein [Elusimicrobiota bacterium]
MKALVYHGPGKIAWEEKPRPALQDATDAIVRITTTTICGTDLHILKGDLPEVTDGRILGHEAVGVVEEIGAGVTAFKKGDKVIVSCITSCAKCDFCRKAMYSHCRRGGWILGFLIDGTQAEYARVPFADTSLHAVPEKADDEAMVMLSDILPTGFECGVLKGAVQPGGSVAIVGAGPIGLAALLTAKLYSPAKLIVIDQDDNRLIAAIALGATHTINNSDGKAAEKVLALTGGLGADAAIEAVGLAATFELCQRLLAPGGHLANIGVHGKSATLHLETLWSRTVTVTTRLVDTSSTPMLLKAVAAGGLDPKRLVSHRFPLADAMKAYEVFGNAAKEKALKVLLSTR